MSTVLRPVGPLEPRVYWIRRAIILTMVFVVIIVLAEACSGGGGGGGKGHKAATKPTVSPSPTKTATVPTGTACVPDTLTLKLATDAASYTVGQVPQLKATISNPGATACTLTATPSNEIWTIKSGSDTIWSTQGCPASTVAKKLTIKSGGKKTVTTTWNGKRLGAKCAIGAAAQPGTYTLTATIDDVSATGSAGVVVFHITG